MTTAPVRDAFGAPGARLLETLARASALSLAARTGLLAHLAEAEGPIADPAGALDLDAENVELVLAVLAHAGLVTRTPAGWEPRPWLRAAGRQVVGGVDGMVAALSADEAFLRAGAVAPPFRARTHDAAVVRELAAIFAAPVRRLAAALGPVEGPILDLGAGSAAWSLAMLAGSPGARGVAVDRGPVLTAARQRAAELGVGDRLETVAADLLVDPLPAGPFPRIVLANVLHLLAPDDACALIRRAGERLAPGGRLVLVDVLEAPGRPLRDAYALQLRMRVATGTVHAPADLVAACTRAGLRVVDRLDLGAEGTPVHLGALLVTSPEAP